MSRTVLFSTRDKAGANIARMLKERFGTSCVGYDGEILRMDKAPFFSADVCIVASRHKSESGTPTLTAHSPGNYGPAMAGGIERELSFAPALFLMRAIKSLQEKGLPGYEACLEATHHGPTSLPFPVLFVEVGSSEKEWADEAACGAAAGTINELLCCGPEALPVAIGFGGGHYCRKFSLVRDYAIGHICPKHSLHCLDEEMVSQMIRKTVPVPECALLEKKGLGPEKQRVMALLEVTDLEMKWI